MGAIVKDEVVREFKKIRPHEKVELQFPYSQKRKADYNMYSNYRSRRDNRDQTQASGNRNGGRMEQSYG